MYLGRNSRRERVGVLKLEMNGEVETVDTFPPKSSEHFHLAWAGPFCRNGGGGMPHYPTSLNCFNVQPTRARLALMYHDICAGRRVSHRPRIVCNGQSKALRTNSWFQQKSSSNLGIVGTQRSRRAILMSIQQTSQSESLPTYKISNLLDIPDA